MVKKHILFDYGRTVVEHPGDGTAILARRGITDPAQVKALRDIIFSMGNFLDPLDEGSMTREVYHKKLRQLIPSSLLPQALDAADYHIGELAVLPGMEELLQQLKQDGFKLYLLSNMDALHMSQMPDVPVTRYFDGMLFSAELGVRKPADAFFEAALSRFGLNPEDCLFIDDLAENVAGAAQCGIKGLVFYGDPSVAADFIYGENHLPIPNFLKAE